MHRPRRSATSRCFEYNGMLHEEELALRRALHASLAASKTTETEDPKHSDTDSPSDDSSLLETKKRKTSSLGELANKSVLKMKRKSIESESNDKKRRKKLLVRIKPSIARKKSLIAKKKREGGEVKVIKKRRRRRKNLDERKDENSRTAEGLPKVHVQRKFAQANPASPRSLLYYQSQLQPMKTRAKTEDFLDFLCLRGTTHLPKTLEIFSNPCAPVSPLSDDNESDKASPSSTSVCDKNDNESDAKQSLVFNVDGQSSNSSSLVSTPVSSRVQPHVVLPEFTNNHSFTRIPTPIPYPSTHAPLHRPGFDEYGALKTNMVTPSLVPSQPIVSSVVMETHASPEKLGFHRVSQSGSKSEETSSPKKFSENSDKTFESPKEIPMKIYKSVKQSPPKNKISKLSSEVKKSPKQIQRGRENSQMKNVEKTLGKGRGKKSENSRKSLDNKIKNDAGKQTDYQNNVPIFSPTEMEFKNPLKYLESIRTSIEPFGICVIDPPKTWQPEYCLSDEIRFTTKLQRIHCLGKICPEVEKELAGIKKHLEHQSILLSTMPQIAGCEIDLPFMSKVVAEFGGLQQVIDRRKWGKVADELRIPKTAVDRITKLEHIYCKYLLSYDMLSEEDKTKLRDYVKEKQDGESSLKYITKGRSMSLAIFQRNAKNISEYYIDAASIGDIEQEFWKVISEGERYVVVHAAEIGSTAFPTNKAKPFYKSKWNLNVLPKSPGSLARDLPDVDGITSPIVKVQMALSTETWTTSPHDLYNMEYLHQGEDKIWYSIPKCSKERFLAVMKAELNEDIDDMRNCMIPHSLLVKSGVPVYRVVQEAGQFIVKFPEAYHSSLSTGFSVSEFVSFSSMPYLPTIKTTFQESLKSSVNHVFSWESLIMSSVKEELRRNCSEEVLNILLPELEEIRDVEMRRKNELANFGVVEQSESEHLSEKKSRGRRRDVCEIENCDNCNRFCFPSMILDKSDTPLCLHHGLEKVQQDKSIKLSLKSHISMEEINGLLREAKEKLEIVRASPTKGKKRKVVNTADTMEGNDKQCE